jgi:hypothetical protein
MPPKLRSFRVAEGLEERPISHRISRASTQYADRDQSTSDLSNAEGLWALFAKFHRALLSLQAPIVPPPALIHAAALDQLML